MPVIEIDTTINRNITEVYKAVTAYDEPENMMQWRPDIQSIGITAGNPLRAGSMIAMTKRFMGRSTFVNADITIIERNKRLELKGVHGRFPFTRSIEFTPSGRETVIRDKFNLKTSWFWFWYAPFVGAALRKQLTAEWQRLKEQLESERF